MCVPVNVVELHTVHILQLFTIALANDITFIPSLQWCKGFRGILRIKFDSDGCILKIREFWLC
jgi:hypothetical protein